MAYQHIYGGTYIVGTDIRGLCLYTAQTAGAGTDNRKTHRNTRSNAKWFYFSNSPTGLLRLSTVV
ncbi:protein of unknown function [Xenorhabdus nematophila AN6/1]|nr:protein of unknown function [Xenorhabdus nematophila AN6/1]